jgi:serine/threonine protein kinase
MSEAEGDHCSKCGAELSSAPLDSSHLSPGTVLEDRYYIGYCCEQTPVFIAYSAWDMVENKRIIINEYFPAELCSRLEDGTVTPSEDKDSARLFKNGLKAFRADGEELKNIPNTDVIGCIRTNNTCYIIRKYLTSLNVAQLLSGEYELNNDYARRVLILLLRTLARVSKLGIVHGNIKPETIYFNRDTSVTIADFSFSGYLSAYIKTKTTADDAYAPIEQYTPGSKLTPAVDVYSASSVFYTMLTGEEPPSATGRAKVETLVAPSVRSIDIKPHIENALMNALNIYPENRTKNVGDFYAELKDKNTQRHWERLTKRHKKSKVDITQKGFWKKVFGRVILLILLVAFIAIIAQYNIIRKQTENAPELEISTESVEDVLKDGVSHPTTEDYTEETTSRHRYNKNDVEPDNNTSNNNSVIKPKDKVTSGRANR